MNGSLLWTFLYAINMLVIAYFVILNSVYMISSFIAFRSLRRYTRMLKSFVQDDPMYTSSLPPITLLATAYNEEATAVESVKSLLTLRYPEYEILVVNDGSKDATLACLTEAFQLKQTIRAPTATLETSEIRGIYCSQRYRNLWVVDKVNGGKADALNAGINFCRTPLFCAIDADSLLEPDALSRIVRPFMEDANTVAAGGVIRIANDCIVRAGTVADVRLPRNWIARLQVLEYLRAFLSGRVGWESMNATLIISGAFGLFRRSIVAAAGGYATRQTSFENVGEDMELVIKLHRYCREKKIPYRVAFVPDPVAWTECPEKLRFLGRQRRRWQRGLLEVLFYHIKMLLNPRYGRIGMVAFPYFFFLEGMGPLIEILGYISFTITLLMGFATYLYIVAFTCVAFVLGISLSFAAVALEELSFRRYMHVRDFLWLFVLAVLENFGYRQMNSLWRVQGFYSAVMRKKGWGAMERKGFKTVSSQ